MTMYQPIKGKESIQLVTTPTNRPRSVLMNNKSTKLEEFMMNVHNMSQFRFFIFNFSILFCFAVLIAVLFIVPCEWSNCISSTNFQQSVKFADKLPWSHYIFEDIELKGKPSLIELNQKLVRLVFIGKGSILNSQNVPPRTTRFPSDGGGLIQIDTITGKELWRKRLDPLPDKIDCTLLNNQYKENNEVYCIVGASNGNLLGVISISKSEGKLIWKHTKSRSESNTTKFNNKNDLVYMEFPVIIPDCNSDGVNEMALVQHISSMPSIAIVSGIDGHKMINITNVNCTKMTDIFFKYDMSLYYICHKNADPDLLETIPIKTMLNCSEDWIPDSIHQTKREYDQIEENQYFFALGNYNLSIINSHHNNCPTKCKININIINSSGEVFWSKNSERSYVMKPISFELHNNITGFIIKIWFWENETIENNIKFAKIGKVEHIREEVIVIMYNSSRAEDFRVKNISSNTILQLCENELKCQPKLEDQRYSLNVVDIDNDGYKELMSVLVTFKPVVNEQNQFSMIDKQSLDLISKVTVFQLERQLIQDFDNCF